MTDTTPLEVGARVRIRPDQVERYGSPWKARFARGLEGTVELIHSDILWPGRVMVAWDVPPRAKYPSDWRMQVLRADLVRTSGTP